MSAARSAAATPRRTTAAIVGLSMAIVASVAAILVRLADPAPLLDSTFGRVGGAGIAAFASLGVAWATVGALVTVRRPDNLVGPLCLLTGIASALCALGPAIVFSAASRTGSLAPSVAQWGSWVTGIASMVSALGVLVAMLFPTGRGHTPGWDRAARVLAAFFVIWLVLIAMQPGGLHLIPTFDNPIGIGFDFRPLLGDRSSLLLVVLGTSIGVPVVAACVISRYRAADAIERLQLRWFASAMALMLATLAIVTVAGALGMGSAELPLVTFAFASALVPAAIGVAILRYHLYDIDRLISRTIGYALVTAVLFGVFAMVDLAVGSAVALVLPAEGRSIGVAVATLLVATLFQPLRSRSQTAVDRRFHRARYDAERTVAGFAGRLRGGLDLSAAARELQRTSVEAFDPATAAVWLRHERGARR